MSEGLILNIALLIAGILLAGAVLFSAVRLITGGHVTRRVVAIDTLTTIGVAIIAVFAVSANAAVLLDVALVIAVLGFLGTVAFGFYLSYLADREGN